MGFFSPQVRRAIFAFGLGLACAVSEASGDTAVIKVSFEVQGPILKWVQVRALSRDGSCELWANALSNDSLGWGTQLRGVASLEESWELLWKRWEPWSAEDREAVTKCDQFPCRVKLNRSEVGQMAGARPKDREKKFQFLVKNRVARYEIRQVREEYEFPGDPTDPWSQIQGLLEKNGLVPTGPLPVLPPKGSIWARKINFDPGRVRTIRQILDRRVARNSASSRVTVWIRDAYTDHYFDSWGEWTDLDCGHKKNSPLLTQVMILELDELKKTDLLTNLMRGKIISEVEQKGQDYLQEAFRRFTAAGRVQRDFLADHDGSESFQ